MNSATDGFREIMLSLYKNGDTGKQLFERALLQFPILNNDQLFNRMGPIIAGMIILDNEQNQ